MISVFAAKYRREPTDDRSLHGSYSIQTSNSFVRTPTALVPHFLTFFLLVPSISFSPFLLLLRPKTDSGHGGSSTGRRRRFCMPRVPCHTRQQARKSNFHRETYYLPSRVSRRGTGHYREPRFRNTSWKLSAAIVREIDKRRHTSFLLFLRFRETRNILLLKLTILFSRSRLRLSLNRRIWIESAAGISRPMPFLE